MRAADRLQARKVRHTAAACAAAALGMLAVAYAAVPLYDLFCRATGFDGTPIVGATEASRVLDRVVTVRFDANVAPGLQWEFAPETPEIEARLGETKTVFYKVRNAGARATTGIATYNVQPGQAGGYFVKIACFCFQEQRLEAGETMDFPVVFYVDPALADDANLSRLPSLTLSYTYFAARNGAAVAAAKPRP